MARKNAAAVSVEFSKTTKMRAYRSSQPSAPKHTLVADASGVIFKMHRNVIFR